MLTVTMPVRMDLRTEKGRFVERVQKGRPRREGADTFRSSNCSSFFKSLSSDSSLATLARSISFSARDCISCHPRRLRSVVWTSSYGHGRDLLTQADVRVCQGASEQHAEQRHQKDLRRSKLSEGVLNITPRETTRRRTLLTPLDEIYEL